MKQIERYLEISKQAKEISKELKKFKFELDKEITEDWFIEANLDRIENKFNELDDTIIKIIGQMYSGDLISGYLKIKKGKLYYFYGRDSLSSNTVLSKLKENESESEVLEKLGKEKVTLINNLRKIYNKCLDSKEGLDQNKKQIKIKIEPIVFAESDYGNDISITQVDNIIIDKEGISIFNKDNIINYNDKEYIIIEKYKDQLKKSSEEFLIKYLEYEKDLDQSLEETKKIGGKYLITLALANGKN